MINNKINLASFPELADLTKILFHTELSTIKNTNNIRQLFKEDYIGFGQGNICKIEEVVQDRYASRKPESAESVKARVGTGYSINIEPFRFSKSITISWEARNLSKSSYNDVINKLKSLAHYVPNRMALDLTHRITFGDSIQYVTMDGDTIDLRLPSGRSLFNNAHIWKYTDRTSSNIVPGNPSFSLSALELAENQGVQAINHFGDMVDVNYDKIFCANNPTTINAIRMVLNSTSTRGQDGANNNSNIKNPVMDKYDLVVLPFLDTDMFGRRDITKSKWWGLVDTSVTGFQGHLKIWENPTLAKPVENKNQDVETMVTGTYGIGILNPNGIVLSPAV
jgi:hypothetical protein